jgi:hypothetical protein
MRAVSAAWRGRDRGAFYRLGEEERRSSEGGRRPAAIEVGRGFNALVTTLEGVVEEGKQRRREAAQLHILRRAARGHGTAAARLGRWRWRYWEPEVGDEARVGRIGPRRLLRAGAGPKDFFGL